ncbi:MAG: FkbM family methyltransferase [Acidobacteria bacterium]|nr:FkbM family methyltransferase [Acidobacteriota bacterium]
MSLLGALGAISAYFRFDLAYRFLRRMPAYNRRELIWRIMADEHVDSACFRTNGFTWHVPMKLGLPLELFRSGDFQGQEVDALCEWIGHHGLLQAGRDTIIDVGANLGTTSVPIARRLGCRILAVEPAPLNLRFLEENLRANGCAAQVTVAPRAVLREPGVIQLLLPTDDPGGYCVDRGTVRAGLSEQALNSLVEARADRLDAIALESGVSVDQVALVWSDTQGCEAEVMETGVEFWSRGAPFYTEIEPLSLRRQGALDTFAGLAGRYFDRYIEAKDIVARRGAAPTHPIAEFAALLNGLPADATVDVLFLPGNCRLKG